MSETAQEINSQGRRRFLEGIVLSDKMNKTRVVQVRWRTKHPKYLKVVFKANKYKAHDEKNESKAGDTVRIMETRPLSKDKRWVIKEIVQKGQGGPAS
jgi:small subunit ribosomal protein S17